MTTNFDKVAEFMMTFKQDVHETPTFPDHDTQNLRLSLIKEEFEELIEAVYYSDMVEIADALTDLLYVIYGAGHAYGIDLDKCFQEVHDSNMSKLEDGKVLYSETGKVLKGKYYFTPNIKKVLDIK